MLKDWLGTWAERYLAELYRLHSPPLDEGCSCTSDASLPALFKCSDCLSSVPCCQRCIVRNHSLVPTHRIQQWNGTHWAAVILKDLGHQLHLGGHSRPCRLGVTTDLTVGDLNGFHEIRVVYCGCPHAPDHAFQLLQSHIYPCSEALPSSGFTFALLRQFHLASTEAKVPAKAFFMVVQRQTNNVYPHKGPDRYRELLRASRGWMFLSDQKRAGIASERVSPTNDVALVCPACPRLDINYTLADILEAQRQGPSLKYSTCPSTYYSIRFLWNAYLSYDGTFQLVKKNKSSDEHDLCLSDGGKFWVDQATYQEHLKANDYGNSTQSAKASPRILLMVWYYLLIRSFRRDAPCHLRQFLRVWTWFRQPSVTTIAQPVECGRRKKV